VLVVTQNIKAIHFDTFYKNNEINHHETHKKYGANSVRHMTRDQEYLLRQ